MRSLIIVIVAAVLVIAAYVAWPFLGLYQLASAIHSGDTNAALARIDVPAVRRSIVYQALNEGSRITKVGRHLKGFERQLALNASTSYVDQQLAGIVTPDFIEQLIAKGQIPENFAPADPSATHAVSLPSNPLRYIHGWGLVSPVKFEVTLGVSSKQEDWGSLVLRRRGLLWRLTEVSLPQSVVQRLAATLKAKMESGNWPGGAAPGR
ncbi:Protein of unknown function [Faunimonas pinastri]|uniref:DUF2939 domain-containing protein n=1 Tax=Faunimonas pinastri TaxID=1855383 RepID=A0A1H9M1P6_9HYPH|nr:DUF2939 domain-containing protein [Faunimonas pinastri]SER17592.1 Protein of unknown function [Faunimonas pinastri]